MPITLIILFDADIPASRTLRMGWWVHISIGEWDTYQETYLFSPTKPTARQVRKAVKQFKRGN